MVEGPGCKLKGEKLQGRATGQYVKGVKGNAVDKHMKQKRKKASNTDGPPPAPLTSPFHQLIGHTCSSVQTVGKELFMFFEGLNQCLRVHFLMAGGFRVNGEKIDGDGGGNAQTPSLVLLMSKDQITFNKSSTEMRSVEDCLARIANFKHLDICSSRFSQQRAVKTLAAQNGSRIVTDLLLDQDLLPGVGNIIKNEAMFDSRIRPDTKLSALSEDHLTFLVKMTRDFSMLFYECRRTGKALEPHLKIYRKGKCKVCGAKATTTRLGEDNPRLTSFCPSCQDNDITKLQGKQPAKNSLLGWVTTGKAATVDSAEWSCEACTLLNKATNSNCSICLTPRHKPTQNSSDKNCDNKTSNSLDDSREIYQSGNSSVYAGIKKRLSSNSTQQKVPALPVLSPPPSSNEPPAKKARLTPTNILTDAGQSVGAPKVMTPIPFMRSMANRRTRSTSQATSQQNFTRPSSGTPQQSKAETPAPSRQANSQPEPPSGVKSAKQFCPQHRAPCVIREVRKNNHNKQRMFHSCPVKQCSFFSWADEKFPECEGHGKRCVLRTVYKEGSNNGRKFFACSMPKNKQCKTFTWADEYNDVTVR